MAARVRVLSGWSIGTEAQFTRAESLYRAGVSVPEIARRLGYDVRTIHRWLNKNHRLPRRGRGWNMRGKPIRHGTISGYGRCRKRPEGSCASCRKANTDYHREWATGHDRGSHATNRG